VLPPLSAVISPNLAATAPTIAPRLVTVAEPAVSDAPLSRPPEVT
jgi:hypothetical protein